MNKLPILEEGYKSKRQLYEEAMRQTAENVSLEQLDPFKTAQGRLRIARTLEFLEKHVPIKESVIADLGCGTGALTLLLAKLGAQVTAVDVSDKVLQHCLHPSVACRRACLPYLPFSDSSFEGIVCTEVIAEIDPALYRLTFSELSRLLKRDGWLVISTQLDLYSADALEQFMSLITTEFEMIKVVSSYHRLFFYLSKLFKRSIQQKQKILMACESFSKFLWGIRGITHVIVLARKKKI